MDDFPWLELGDEIGGETVMWCSLCRRNNCRPKRAPLGKAVWIEIPCKTITRQSLRDHAESDCHKEAMHIESSRILSTKQGGITEAMDAIVSLQKKAFIGHLKCMHYLAKQEIAHTTKFTPLIQLAKSLGTTYLGEIAMGGNMKYTSECFMQEIVLALAETVIKPIKEDMLTSPVFSLLIDETTDVSVVKQMIVYGRYLSAGEATTRFLGIVELHDGTATTITDALLQFCREMELDIHKKLVGLGSDGDSVMLGCRGGVSTLMKEQAPFLIANHCVAHRLALACGQAADEIKYLKKFKSILDQLYRFYQNSAVRMAGLKAIQEVVNDPQLKLTQAKDVRWLSHEKAVRNLCQCLPSVLTSLEREATERHDAQAHGLALFVKDFFFTSSIYFLSDILPPLAQLSRAFQKTAIDFSMVKALVQGTKDCMRELMTKEGECFSKFPTDAANIATHGFQDYTDERMTRFRAQVYQPYLNTLLQHLDSRFPDVGLLEAFSFFDPNVMKNQSELLETLEVLTVHYGPHNVIDAESAPCEYKCFLKSVLATPHLHELSTHDLMC